MAYSPLERPSVFPPVIKNVMIITGLAFFAQQTPGLGSLLFEWGSLWPVGDPGVVRTPQGIRSLAPFYPWQVVSYAFLHGDFGHILFNIFAFWMFGVPLENTWGSKRFALYYFVSVVGAALTQLAVMYLTEDFSPVVGASGGVFGILLAFGMMYPEQRIYLYFAIPVKAKYFVIGYGVLELILGVSSTNSNVAHFAHLGGLFAGLALILYWRSQANARQRATGGWRRDL